MIPESNDVSQGLQLPSSWCTVSFDEGVEVISDEGKRVEQAAYHPVGRIPVVDQGQDFIGGYTDDVVQQYQGQLPVVLFGDHTRRIKHIDFRFAVGAQGVKILRPRSCWEPKFFAYLVPTLPLPDKGYSRHFQFLRKLIFPLAPLPEQQRIVAEIEKQLTRLDAAVAALRRVQANLKRYRASVLKTACEGRLVPTEAELARREGRDYEPADRLLARILKERRATWEADQLAKMQAAGKTPKDDTWKAKYHEPAAPDTSTLPELPEGWVWAKMDQVLSFLRNGIPTKPDAMSGTRILRISAVRPGSVNLGDVRYLSGPTEKFSNYLIQPSDLLFTRYNGNPELVGVCGVVRGQPRDTVHPDKLIRGQLASRLCLPSFVEPAINTGPSRAFLAHRIRTTAGQAGVSGQDIRAVPIPLPPADEQSRIVAEVERRVCSIRELEVMTEGNLKRAERLRQAILKRAFEGKLVPQDPNDEPAGALLERIRAERTKAEQTRAPRGERSRRATSRGQRTKAEL